MSESDDALRAMAANRGCRLVKSRRRKPGGDFGKYGLKDAATGKEVLGFGAKGLTATREEIRTYLRGSETASWKRSLIAAVPDSPPPPRRKSKKDAAAPPKRKGKAETKPEGKPEPKAAPARAETSRRQTEKKKKAPAPPPEPKIREARPKDAATLAALLDELGYEAGEADVRRQLDRLRKSGEPALVAELDGVIGCLTWHVTPVIHRPAPVGRITMMVVAQGARGQGVGTRLLEEAERRLRERGCGLVEVTSNIKRMRAHGFYERHGFARTSYRFVRPLD